MSQNARCKLASEDELLIITQNMIKEVKLERKYHPKKQRLMYEMTERQIGDKFNMSTGTVFRESEKELKVLLEDKVTH
jgi:hypothetical protein